MSNLYRREFFKYCGLGTACAGLFSACLPLSAFAGGKDDIAYLSAIELIKRLKSGALSPVDVLKVQIERIYA